MSKLQKTAKILDVVFLVLFWCQIIFLVGSVFILLWGAMGAKGSLSAFNGLVLSFGGLQASKDVLTSVNLMPAYVIAAFFYVLSILLRCFTYGLIRKILLPLKYGEAFALSISRDFRRLALLCLGSCVLNLLFAAGWNLSLFTAVPFSSYEIWRSIFSSLDFSCLILAVFFLLFSQIFSHGEELQALSDETV